MHAVNRGLAADLPIIMTQPSARSACRIVMLLGALAGTTGLAANKTWSGAGPNPNWSTAANWAGGVAPANNDVLIFTGATRTSTTNDLGSIPSPYAVNTIAFDANAGAFTLGGNPIQPQAGTFFYVNSDSPLAQTIGVDIAAGAWSTIWQPKRGNLVMKGAITGSRGNDFLVKEEAGTLVLQGALSGTAATPGLQVRNGTAVVDLDAGAAVTNSTLLTLGNTVIMTDVKLDEDRQNATLVVRGKSTGTSHLAFSGITVNPEASMSRIVVDPNGGEGTTLAFGPTWNMPYTIRTSGFHVDLSRPGAVATLATVTRKNNYSIIVPSFTVRDATGQTDFAVANGLGQIVRNPSASEYTGGATIPGASYFVTGDVSVPAGTTIWALTLKGASMLTLPGHAVINGLVMEEGAGNCAVTGAAARLGMADSHAFYIHQHSLAGSLTYDCAMLGEFYKMGPGKMIVKRDMSADTYKAARLYVVEGEVEVQGVLADPTRIHRVFAGATLSGRGQIVSSVTVHPGAMLDGSHVATNALAIGGNLRLKKGSALKVDIGRTAHAALQVAGTVANEGADLRLALVDRPRVGSPVTLIAGTTISAPFTTVNGVALGAGGAFTLDYAGTREKFVLDQTATQVTATCAASLGTVIVIR